MHAPAAPWRNGPLVPLALQQAAADVPPELHAFVANLAKAESRSTATMAETADGARPVPQHGRDLERGRDRGALPGCSRAMPA